MHIHLLFLILPLLCLVQLTSAEQVVAARPNHLRRPHAVRLARRAPAPHVLPPTWRVPARGRARSPVQRNPLGGAGPGAYRSDVDPITLQPLSESDDVVRRLNHMTLGEEMRFLTQHRINQHLAAPPNSPRGLTPPPNQRVYQEHYPASPNQPHPHRSETQRPERGSRGNTPTREDRAATFPPPRSQRITPPMQPEMRPPTPPAPPGLAGRPGGWPPSPGRHSGPDIDAWPPTLSPRPQGPMLLRRPTPPSPTPPGLAGGLGG